MQWLVIVALWLQVSISPLGDHEFTEDKFAVFTICDRPVLFVAEVGKKIALTTPERLHADPMWARAWMLFVQKLHPRYQTQIYRLEKYHPDLVSCPESDEEAKWNTEPMGRKYISRGSQTI